MRLLNALAAGAVLSAFAVPADAQQSTPQAQNYRTSLIVAKGGYINYERDLGLRPAPFVGMDLRYRITPFFALAPSVTVSQPRTDGDYFGASLIYDDTTYFFQVSQPVTMLDVGLNAVLSIPEVGAFAPYVSGGGGVYAFYLDPQVNSARDKRFSRFSLSAGAGATVRLKGGTGLQFEVRDFIMLDTDRERFNPVGARFNNSRFAEDFRAPSVYDKGSASHNLVFSVGFTFTPNSGAGRDTEEDR